LNRAKILAIPDLAKGDPRLGIKAGEFDSDPWLLNTPSGTVELEATGALREHRREDFNAKITGVPYDPNASAPYWLTWLHWASAGRPDWVEHLQRAMGYALSGDTGEQVFWLFHGVGANGKSTFLTVMELVLGDYAWHAEAELLTPKEGSSTTGVTDLQGKRFVVATETKEGKKLDERQVKQLTGQDTITARRLYQDFMAFRPTHKIFFAVNHRPHVTDTSPAFWRRVLLLPWDSTVPTEMQKRNVAEWIVNEEGPGVLRWAVEGCLKWQRDGLKVPNYVRAKTKEYQTDEDVLAAFIKAHLVKDEQGSGFVSTTHLWKVHIVWCDHEGMRKPPLGRTSFLAAIEGRLGLTRDRHEWQGSSLYGYKGWHLIEEGGDQL
jgi:putative DNA primase/helicase